ncbi:hypothetical protein CBM2633_A50030 [Cupriavidus taiwanensis]|uniref:Uncharacterized protein n=1 Tax=Cupriavidus taiwanensis TaxID=164546 RepID=A0A375BCG5_9BURK|nr:hypothetical protein CBM2586_A11064 [Cupriavidus taiwanensis]SOY55106.1 hypothetical protein CBM2587_A50089 [Cupriavidus taiwanensis]SOY56207.1 hypothetical protein CBM2588_A60076 [Cupriavidus taiwanensis]SOY56783.1 hypothetical protein CBM2592_A90078 [Cupriavidus taiwanensis]SOY87096.1 hypothetical protein CBM2599_A40423 [Cupriavidus taiwanensis]
MHNHFYTKKVNPLRAVTLLKG